MRTTASVDIQVCAASVLTEDRPGVEATVLAELHALLDHTTAVYLVSYYTTASTGLICWRFVYQAPSPDAASMAETLIAQQPAGPGLLSLPYQGQTVQCTTSVQPWRGEAPPLPLWDLSASDLMLLAGAIGAALALCLIAMCCFVALARAQEDRRAHALLQSDHAAIRRLLKKWHGTTTTTGAETPNNNNKA